MKKIFSLFVAATIILTLSVSCNNDSKKQDNSDEITDSILSADNVKKFIYPIPTPFEVSQMLQNAGASFILDITNPVDNADKYFSEKQKAINLGVYGADLTYTTTYNKTQETRNFLAVTKQLTDDLGIASLFNRDLMERVEENIENQDSLYKIVNESFYDTFNWLNANGKGDISVLVLAGGWIEAMYLTSELIGTVDNKKPLVDGISNQKFVAHALQELLHQHSDNPDVKELYEKMKPIFDILDRAVNENDVMVLKDSDLDEFTAKVKQLREEIIKA